MASKSCSLISGNTALPSFCAGYSRNYTSKLFYNSYFLESWSLIFFLIACITTENESDEIYDTLWSVIGLIKWPKTYIFLTIFVCIGLYPIYFSHVVRHTAVHSNDTESKHFWITSIISPPPLGQQPVIFSVPPWWRGCFLFSSSSQSRLETCLHNDKEYLEILQCARDLSM